MVSAERRDEVPAAPAAARHDRVSESSSERDHQKTGEAPLGERGFST
jgi:hypothetical protein